MTETSTQKTTGAVDGKFKIVVTSDRYGNETHGLELEQELAAGVADLDVTLVGRASTSEDDLIRAAQDADALLVSTREAVTRRVLENIPRVKVISRYGVGLDNVDLDAAADAGIVVTHYPGYCTSEVADHALAMILALNRRIVEQDRALREGAWVEHGPSTRRILRGPIQPLREQTLGIVGFGRIGQAVAARAKPFNLTIVAADPYIDPEVMVAAGVEPVPLEDLLRRSDIVTLHTPLTPETRGLIDAAALELMKPTAVLVNTARGPIIDLPALARGVARGEDRRRGPRRRRSRTAAGRFAVLPAVERDPHPALGVLLGTVGRRRAAGDATGGAAGAPRQAPPHCGEPGRAAQGHPRTVAWVSPRPGPGGLVFRRRRAAPATSSPAPLPAANGSDAPGLTEFPDREGEPAHEVAGDLPAPAEVRDDEVLVRAAQAGDLEAFNLLVQRHERPVFNVALRLLRDVGLAEDATQDTFIRAWQNIRTFQTGSVRSWLYKIATNRSYDMLRASARRPAGSLEAEIVEIEPIWTMGGAGDESPDGLALRRELSIYLERALTALPEDQRMVVLLVDVQGLDYHEVAETLGIALGTVKSRLSRARARIRQALADDAPARELFERYLRLEEEDEGVRATMPVTPTTEPDDD